MTTTGPIPALPLDRPSPLEPAAELARLRAESPVCEVRSEAGEPAWLVTRYAEARTVLTDRRFSLAVPGPTPANGANDSLFQDPPGHTRLRGLVSAVFTPRRVGRLRSRVSEVASGLVEEMASRQWPQDLMETFAFPLPITIIGELLGVPASDRQGFRRWSDAMLSLSQDSESDPGAGWENLSVHTTELIARKRRDPGDDLLSDLIAVRDADGDRLSEAELEMMAITLVIAGYVTTSVAVGVGVVLLSALGQIERVAGHPQLVPSAIEEILRFQCAAGDLARRATEDVELGGVQIHLGDKVVISVTSANRDERRFAHPERFDVTRADNGHLTFGLGIHHCLGAALARLELQVALTTLVRRFPTLRLAVAPEDLVWRRSELFGDQWPQSVPVQGSIREVTP